MVLLQAIRNRDILGTRASTPTAGGHPLTGRILCQFQVNEPTHMILLADRQHLPHPSVQINDPNASLTVRDHPNEPATPISRDRWSFVQLETDPEPYYISLVPDLNLVVYTNWFMRLEGAKLSAWDLPLSGILSPFSNMPLLRRGTPAPVISNMPTSSGYPKVAAFFDR